MSTERERERERGGGGGGMNETERDGKGKGGGIGNMAMYKPTVQTTSTLDIQRGLKLPQLRMR